LDAESLKSAELVCKEWLRVISEGMLWKKLIERKVRTDSLWRGLAERRNWMQYLFKPRPGQTQRKCESILSLIVVGQQMLTNNETIGEVVGAIRYHIY